MSLPDGTDQRSQGNNSGRRGLFRRNANCGIPFRRATSVGDTVLEEDWETAVAQFINAVASKKVAGVFRYQNDINSSAGKLLEQYVAWRTKLGLPYGDQGLLISREIYEKLGGFRKIEIMEDVDFVCKIGFKNIRIIPACATTSGSRYSRNGILFRGMRNLLCLGLYFLGVSPRVIARIYQ